LVKDPSIVTAYCFSVDYYITSLFQFGFEIKFEPCLPCCK